MTKTHIYHYMEPYITSWVVHQTRVPYSLSKYRWTMSNQGCQVASGSSSIFQVKGPASVWPLCSRWTQNTADMASVLLEALFLYLNAMRNKSLSDSTFLSWGSRMTAGLCLSFGTLPAFAWILGLFLNGRAFCKAFGMCSELKCFFCLRIGWKGKNKTDYV